MSDVVKECSVKSLIQTILHVAGVGICLCWAGGIRAQEKPSELRSEHLLPNSTRAWISVPDPKKLNDAFAATQIGKLTTDEQLKPFFEDLADQLRDRFNDGEVRHGIRLSKFEGLETGEICLAGVLPRDAAGEVQPNKHGLLLLVDVAKCKEQATQLLKETADELREKGVTSSTEKFGEIEATKWAFPKREGSTTERVAFHAIVDKWLISSDNSDLFDQVVKRIAEPATAEEGSLAKDPVFTEVQKRCQFEDGTQSVHARWYVDPFGYLDLARVIAEEDQDPDTKQRSNNFAKIVSNSGFDAIKGVAGNFILATGQQEMIHRTFVYAPPDPTAGENKLPKAAAILDFVNAEKITFEPESWVPETAASYISFTWNLEKVVNNVHHAVDAVTDQGSFENMLKNIKEQNHVDVRELITCLNNRISVVSEIVTPIDINSEKILVGIGIKKDVDNVRQQVKNFFGGALKTETVGDKEIYYEEVVEIEDDDYIFGEFEDEAEQEVEEKPALMDQKFVTVHQDYILISNDLEYLKRVITAEPQKLQSSQDFKRIREALAKIAPTDVASAQHFTRLDRVLEANYELIKSDKIETANTMFAKMIAAARAEAEKEGIEPKKFDPAEMPDYRETVAPSLGPTGLVVESKKDGWLITSCLLTRDAPVASVATEPDIEKKDQ